MELPCTGFSFLGNDESPEPTCDYDSTPNHEISLEDQNTVSDTRVVALLSRNQSQGLRIKTGRSYC